MSRRQPRLGAKLLPRLPRLLLRGGKQGRQSSRGRWKLPLGLHSRHQRRLPRSSGCAKVRRHRRRHVAWGLGIGGQRGSVHSVQGQRQCRTRKPWLRRCGTGVVERSETWPAMGGVQPATMALRVGALFATLWLRQLAVC